MANCCFFKLKAVGFKNEFDKELFCKLFNNEWFCNNVTVNSNMAFWPLESILDNEGENWVQISGDAKWCLDNIVRDKTDDNWLSSIKKSETEYDLDGIATASQYLGLEVQVYGETDEDVEFYHLKNGDIVKHKVADIHYVPIYEYETFEDFQNAIDDESCGNEKMKAELEGITKEEFELLSGEGDGITIGGFKCEEFTI